MKKVSIRQALIDAIDETDPLFMRYELQAIKWAKYIEKQIGSINGYSIKAKSFKINGSEIEAPSDCLNIHRIVYGNYEDDLTVMYKDVRGSTIQEDQRLEGESVVVKLWMPAEIPIVPDTLWEQRIDIIHFVMDMMGKEVTIIYDHIDSDDDGYWLVSDNHIKAISDYLVFKFAKKNVWKTLRSEKMLRQGELNNVEILRRDYERSIRNARATDSEENEFERSQY